MTTYEAARQIANILLSGSNFSFPVKRPSIARVCEVIKLVQDLLLKSNEGGTLDDDEALMLIAEIIDTYDRVYGIES